MRANAPRAPAAPALLARRRRNARLRVSLQMKRCFHWPEAQRLDDQRDAAPLREEPFQDRAIVRIQRQSRPCMRAIPAYRPQALWRLHQLAKSRKVLIGEDESRPELVLACRLSRG